MGQRHPLATDGAWVELRDPSELRAGDQMDIRDAMDDDGTTGRRLNQMYTALVGVLVTNWSLPLPVPTPGSQESVRLMGIKDWEALKELVSPAVDVVFPTDPEPETPEELEAAKADAASPTGDADAS